MGLVLAHIALALLQSYDTCRSGAGVSPASPCLSSHRGVSDGRGESAG